MPPETKPATLKPAQTAIAVVLTLTAGYVDSIGFLRLNGVYVANMSGNSVAVGMHFARGDWATVLERLLPIACYAAALLCTRILVNIAVIRRIKRSAAASLLLEVLFLVMFMRSTGLNSGIVFAAIAMGIQAATISRFNGVTVYTAFVTGSLVRFAESLSEELFALRGGDPEVRKQAWRNAIWFAGVWLAYVAGAVGGALMYASAGLRAVIAACVVIAGLAVTDMLHPADVDVKV